jgi:hypothetical protein
MLGYRANTDAVTARAVEAGITPSTAELAAVTGFPERTVARIRRGESVSRRTAKGFAAELGAACDQLFRAVKVR